MTGPNSNFQPDTVAFRTKMCYNICTKNKDAEEKLMPEQKLWKPIGQNSFELNIKGVMADLIIEDDKSIFEIIMAPGITIPLTFESPINQPERAQKAALDTLVKTMSEIRDTIQHIISEAES